MDTVYLGAFRKSLFGEIGLFDPAMQFNEDNEFNMRIIKNGGKILLSPRIKSYYFLRGSLKELWHRYLNYGYFKVKVLRKHKTLMSYRHFVPAGFVGAFCFSLVSAALNTAYMPLFLGVAGVYTAASLMFSLLLSVKYGFRYAPALPVVFAALHFGYGIGFLKGLCDFLALKKA